MQEPAKNFNRASESQTNNSFQADASFESKSEQKPNLPSTSADNNENNQPSRWKRFWQAYSNFYDRIKLVLALLWIVAFLLIILPHFGGFIIDRSLSSPQELPAPLEPSKIIVDESKNAKLISVSQRLLRRADASSADFASRRRIAITIDGACSDRWSNSRSINIENNQIQINTELLNTLDFAHRNAEARAIKKLDSYIENLMFRVDNDFLNWYFNFFNKKWREDSALITWISGGNVRERQGKIFVEEFSKRVVSKTEAEQKIKQIVDDATETYVSLLEHKLDRIGFKYNIPQDQWNEYLDNITFNIPGTGNASLADISAVSYPLAKVIAIPSLKTVSVLGAERITAVAGAKYAAKLGIKGAGETAIGTLAKVADPLVLIGFVLWEVGDYYATVEEQKPALRNSFLETFKEIENDILYDRSSGIISTLYHLENNIRDSIVMRSNSQQNASIPTIQS